MALVIVDGNPGSGKTLYAMTHLLETYFEEVEHGEYIPKTEFRLVSNIDGLRLDHVKLGEDCEIECKGDYKAYFQRKKQEEFFERFGQIVYLIDEGQFIFDRKFYDNGVFGWVQYHRHYGQAIYIMTQDAKNLPKEIQFCTEFIVHSLPRSKAIHSRFFYYSLLCDGDKVGSKKLIADHKVFAQYKSFQAESAEKTARPFLKTLIMVGFFAVVVFSLGIWKMTSGLKPQSKNTTSQQAIKPSALPSSIPAQQQLTPGTIPQALPHTPITPVFVPQPKKIKISSFTDIKKSGTIVKLMYRGVYTLENFPYPFIKQGEQYYAFIPADEENPEPVRVNHNSLPRVAGVVER